MAKASVRNFLLEPKLVWLDGRFQTGIRIKCGADGRIEFIKRGPGTDPDDEEIVRLPNQALLPGMVNSHSHTFHRGLRDLNESGKDFWAWRDVLYKLVESLTPQKLYNISKQAFCEMLRSGITSVGEFHYFHHSFPRSSTDPGPEKTPYDMDRVILRAAKDVGIRIVLLETYYEKAGLKCEEMPSVQRHFLTKSTGEFWDQVDRAAEMADKDTQSIGVAAHSIRAVSVENIVKLHRESQSRNLPFHIHLEEQPKEIQDSKDVLGNTPSAILLDKIDIDSNFTAVHCIHTSPENFQNMKLKNANFSICPLTEGCLGDGIPPWSGLPCNISFGTDCNHRICMAEEMRWFAYLQQVSTIKRGLDGVDNLPDFLFTCATKNGAKSLGLDQCGELKVGNYCDFFTLDLTSEALKNSGSESLLKSFIFGSATDAVVNSVCVGGNLQCFWKPKVPSIRTVEASNTEDALGSAETGEISADNIDDLLISLMKIDSTSGKEQKVANALSSWLKSRGWVVHNQYFGDEGRSNVLATRSKTAPVNIKVILNTHLDTVPPYISPTVEDGIIYGRGACDAKGVLAAMVFGAEKFLEKHPDLAKSVALLFVAGEEVDHIGALESQKLGLRPEAVICGEPTESKFANVQKGILKINLKCRGIAAHSGYPELGESASEELIDILNDLRMAIWPENAKFGRTTLNFGLIKAGVAANVIPEYAEATLAFRVITSTDEIIDRVESTVAERCEIEITSRSEPIKLDIIGEKTFHACFNTDLGYLGLEPKVKKCLIGPGSIKDAHAPGEFIRIADLHAAVDIYFDLLCRILQR